MTETNRTAIIDKDGGDILLSIVQTSVPGINGIVSTNPDGTIIGGQISSYITAGIDTISTTDVTYIGKIMPGDDGKWIVLYIGTDGITYANNSNNPTYTSYSTAWEDRIGLIYDLSVTF